MIGFFKASPNQFIIKYTKGKVTRKGKGISFFYHKPTTTITLIPMESAEVSFIFSELTRDFQDLAIQGQITYRIADPERISELIDFTHNGKKFTGEDYKKLPSRILNILQEEIKRAVEVKTLREVLTESSEVNASVLPMIQENLEINALGISIMGLRITSLKPTPETSRALEAEMREIVLQEADEAIYRRRNAAIEQERTIQENQLNTDIAVEEKKRQILEKQLISEREELEARAEMDRLNMEQKLQSERLNTELVKLKTENSRKEAETEGYKIAEVMKGYNVLDADILEAMKYSGMTPPQLLADGFRQLAMQSGKISNLTISPDMFAEMVKAGQQ